MTVQEQATFSFYQWELRGRGYYLFDIPVGIEPPYTRFTHHVYEPSRYHDDGKVPSIFSSFVNLFRQDDVAEPKEIVRELIPKYLEPEDAPNLRGIGISLPYHHEVHHNVTIELLNLLSFTSHPVSFEIMGRHEEIRIQIVSSDEDIENVRIQLKAFFPEIVITDIDPMEDLFHGTSKIAIVDFGLDEEFMRPINTVENYKIDPLTSIIGNMEQLREDETVLMQVMFQGVTAPWSQDVMQSVSDGKGGSFFHDAPEMPTCAQEKIAHPLFSVVVRVSCQGISDDKSAYLVSQLSKSISRVSSSRYNKLIPLSNDGYRFDFHYNNVRLRLSNRLGFFLNAKELSTFVHYPNKTVVSEFLTAQSGKTRAVPKRYRNGRYILGSNIHRGSEYPVGVSDTEKLRHCHIIGSTGVGKSTLIAQMVIEDMELGNGLFLFDPHGDIVEDVIAHVPEHRKDDVVLFDPYDIDYPIGFNLLYASSEAEKMVLSSDLVSIFKRFATSWGDNMSSVLSQAVTAFLESTRGGTLIELKRFLLEDDFRNEFLTTVSDPSIHYYWNNEYHHLKKRISPLLTRIDTFLRAKVVRYMLAQKSGIDFKACIEERKIALLKLSQGLIGEENSYLLGSLFLSKINQVALGRQELAKGQRHPFYVYCDEFQNFITPSISAILSGARKYGLGLILVHQDLNQINDVQTMNSVLSNPNIRICFKLGDADANRLSGGFAHFDSHDLQSLNVGETIVRIGSASSDFTMQTDQLPKANTKRTHEVRSYILSSTRSQYGTKKSEVEELLERLLPKRKSETKKDVKKDDIQENAVFEPIAPTQPPSTHEKNEVSNIETEKDAVLDTQKEDFLKREEKRERNRKHRSLQNSIRALSQQMGYAVRAEQETKRGGRVDLSLSKNNIRIAVEIAISNSNEYELGNVKKCLDDGYDLVYVISDSSVHLKNIQKLVTKELGKQASLVFFVQPQAFAEHLSVIDKEDEPKTSKRVKGWRVNVNYHKDDMQQKGSSLIERLKRLIRKKSSNR